MKHTGKLIKVDVKKLAEYMVRLPLRARGLGQKIQKEAEAARQRLKRVPGPTTKRMLKITPRSQPRKLAASNWRRGTGARPTPETLAPASARNINILHYLRGRRAAAHTRRSKIGQRQK